MFKFIRNLFKKEGEVIATVDTLEELDKEITKALDQRDREKEEKMRRELRFIAKFRDIRTGEIHEVYTYDSATFLKLFHDKNMRMLFDV